MSDPLLTAMLEIKELLKLLAEPQLALRDERFRKSLRELVGKNSAKRKLIPLLDGSKTQAELKQLVKIDKSDLSKFIKALRSADLLNMDEKPQLSIEIPPNFFEVEDHE